MTGGWRARLRLLATLLSWLATVLAVATVALFLWAAAPVLAARTDGGAAGLWLFGDSGLVVGAAGAWLAAAGLWWWRRRATRNRPTA